MASDLSSLPNVLGESPSEADYQAVHAELMATERGRNFLTEYATRNIDPDTLKLVSTVLRLESAMRDHRAPQIPDAMFRRLAEAAQAFDQSGAIFSASGGSTANDLHAVERIQDICMALRRRDVEPALCDALERSAREIGDAMVRGNAAAIGASSAASLLRDLLARVRELVGFYDSAISLGAPQPADGDVRREEAIFDERAVHDDADPLFGIAAEKPADDETRGDIDAEWFDHTADESLADAYGAGALGSDRVSSQHDERSPRLTASAPESQASLERESGVRFEPQFDTGPQFTTETEVSVEAETVFPPGILRPVEPAIQRAPQSESLRAILALSEEELIALFT
jgi:hypothetical protein